MQEIELSGFDLTQQPVRAVAKNDGFRLAKASQKSTTIEDSRLSHQLLIDKHLKNTHFKGGSITHCRLEHCKLTEATFDRVDLTDTVFISCDLRKASFNRCTLWYVRFENCEIDYEALWSSIPTESNLRRAFLRRLRMNAIQVGEKGWADKILIDELHTQEKELWDTVVGSSEYYANKHSAFLVRAKAALDLGGQFLNRIWWGYGLRLSNLLYSGMALILIFAAISRLSGAWFHVDGETRNRSLSWAEAIYYSTISLTTGGYGDIQPGGVGARFIASTEGLFGVLFLGFVAAALYRRLSR